MGDFFYESVFRAINRHQVRCLIVGGVAVNLLGVPRMTKDLDLMLDLGEENLRRFIRAVKELGYQPRAPVPLEDFSDASKRAAWRAEKGALVFTLNDPRSPLVQVDVFLENPIDFDAAYRNKVELQAGDVSLSVICAQDLMEMKRKANRLQDQADVAMLSKIRQERLDG